MQNPKHILVIRLSAMGDVAMSVPVLRAFTDQNKDVKITVLSRKFLKPLFEDIHNVSFFAADVTGRHKGLLGLYKLADELKVLEIDAVADIHNVLRSKILRFFLRFSKSKTAIIDKGREEKKALTRIENKIFKQLKTSHERYADVFRKLGFNLDLVKHQFPTKKILSQNILSIIKNKSKAFIGIAPFAQYNTKTYPLDLMEKVIHSLAKSNKYTILLFGGGEEEIEKLKLIEEKNENVISFAGKLKLNDELIVISHLDCMVSMDSANAHLAAMQGIKTITLWGATHPYAGFYPFNQPMKYALIPDKEMFPNIPCSIYGNKTCPGYEDIMRNTQPKEVIDLIGEII